RAVLAGDDAMPELTAIRPRAEPDHAGEVRLVDLPSLELRRDARVGGPTAREEEDAGGVGVEALVDPEVWIGLAGLAEPREQAGVRVVDAFGLGRVRGDTGRLVDDDQIGVVIEDPG